MILAENLRAFRRRLDMTQEETANALGVVPQTVSKWERGETASDIAMLPALVHLFGVSADELLGMDRLHSMERYSGVYTQARVCLMAGRWPEAVGVYEEALHIWPGDSGLLTDLAMALGLCGRPEDLERAVQLCRQVLESASSIKSQHTARAALCYLLAKAGNGEEALKTSRQLPHQRECRETVQANLQQDCCRERMDELIYELSVGESLPK